MQNLKEDRIIVMGTQIDVENLIGHIITLNNRVRKGEQKDEELDK